MITTQAVSGVYSGRNWPDTVSDTALRQQLYPGNLGRPKTRPEPDWATVHQELRHKGVTLALLWSEYHETHPTGYQYSQFCDRYKAYQQRVDVVLRKHYHPGEHCFVDYAGPTVPIYDPVTGAVQAAQVFVAVLGYSNYTFVDLHPQQTTPWWIRGHVDAFAYFGGVPKIVVPDNPKPLVTHVERFDAILNRTYQAFAAHYSVAIVPARPRKPRDKAAAEAGVLLAERRILAKLRHERLVGWDGARERVRQLLDALNAHPFQKLEGSRRSWWEQEERAALAPLPAERFEDEAWRVATVHRDYHIEVDRRYYSVPYRLVGAKVDVRITATLVECFHDHVRVASHPRITTDHWHTLPEHMPPAHRAMTQDWNAESFQRRAGQIGPHTARLITTILDRAQIPEQFFRRCQGILGLARTYSPTVLEQAAQRALQAESFAVRAVHAYCEAVQHAAAAPRPTVPSHENVRGSAYYNSAIEGATDGTKYDNTDAERRERK